MPNFSDKKVIYIGNLVLAKNQNIEYTYEYFKNQKLKTKKLNRVIRYSKNRI